MRDALNRRIDYLRVSVTDRCNLRCRYCMPHGADPVPHERILRFEEILRVCRIMTELGVRHIRVTGGEPLVRRGTPDFLCNLRQLPGVDRLSITTNGALYAQHAAALSPARLDGVNLSLDTLDPLRYHEITGGGALADALSAIDRALADGVQLKLNCVLMRGVNDDEIPQLAALAKDRLLDVRFIELMPLGAGRDFERVPGAEVLGLLRAVYPDLTPVASDSPGPAQYHRSASLRGRIGFIDPIGGHFCAGCNRVRLTSEGYLKLCLGHPDGLDLRALLRGGATDGDIHLAIERAIQQKPDSHRFCDASGAATAGLYTIGG